LAQFAPAKKRLVLRTSINPQNAKGSHVVAASRVGRHDAGMTSRDVIAKLPPTPPLGDVAAPSDPVAVFLLGRYGPLMEARDIVQVLRFNSVDALERSWQRGRLNLNLQRLPGRRGLFVVTTDLVSYLVSISKSGEEPHEKEVRDRER
jgi:hypothetical protein